MGNPQKSETDLMWVKNFAGHSASDFEKNLANKAMNRLNVRPFGWLGSSVGRAED